MEFSDWKQEVIRDVLNGSAECVNVWIYRRQLDRACVCVCESLYWGEVRGMNQIGVCLLEGENGNRKRDSLWALCTCVCACIVEQCTEPQRGMRFYRSSSFFHRVRGWIEASDEGQVKPLHTGGGFTHHCQIMHAVLTRRCRMKEAEVGGWGGVVLAYLGGLINKVGGTPKKQKNTAGSSTHF